MDSSTLIGLVLLFLFIGPIIYIIYNQNKNERLLNKKAKEFDLKPVLTDFTPTLLIGLDTKKNKLIVIATKNRETNLIFLADVVQCEIGTINEPDRPGKLNRINLLLIFRTKDVKPLEIIFHDDDYDINSEAEEQLQIARKWEKIIRRQLSV